MAECSATPDRRRDRRGGRWHAGSCRRAYKEGTFNLAKDSDNQQIFFGAQSVFSKLNVGTVWTLILNSVFGFIHNSACKYTPNFPKPFHKCSEYWVECECRGRRPAVEIIVWQDDLFESEPNWTRQLYLFIYLIFEQNMPFFYKYSAMFEWIWGPKSRA